ncbi:MAG: glutathione peroxidase [Cyclobacteriaceae bacterium]|jgi:glutathione peroxidase
MYYLFIVFQSVILSTMNPPSGNLHQFAIQKLDSEETINFADFAGKKILLVNVASKCGYTSQYEDLQQLHEAYKDRLVIIGLPCNQFGGQEPGSEETIAAFCSATYGVSFMMTTKVDVKGSEQHPIYQWLTQKDQNGIGDYKVKWNFNKFLIDEEGKLIDYFPSGVNPYDKEILNHLD